MNILFIHQNFPGQFKFLAPALTKTGHKVVAMTMQKTASRLWQGVQIVPYTNDRASTAGLHPWLVDFETKTIRGEACMKAAEKLKEAGFTPDVIVAHPGWGESLFLKNVWPRARLGIYCEFYYASEGCDSGFDPEFPSKGGAHSEQCRIQLKNLNNLLHFGLAEAGLSPTHWQASTFPEPFRQRISVVHDGIDTHVVAPNPRAMLSLTLPDGGRRTLTRNDEVVTFVNRNLEPYRGYHTFMRALPELLRQRPYATVLVVGGNDVSYGAKPEGKDTWRDRFAREVRPQISDADWQRVVFLGSLPYKTYLALIQVSTVHVYLTYPFVLSWSLLESMAAGCAVVASHTQPLLEVIEHGETGLLFDFFSPAELTAAVCRVLEDSALRVRLGDNARALACARYDLQTVCLPQQLDWVVSLASLPSV